MVSGDAPADKTQLAELFEKKAEIEARQARILEESRASATAPSAERAAPVPGSAGEGSASSQRLAPTQLPPPAEGGQADKQDGQMNIDEEEAAVAEEALRHIRDLGEDADDDQKVRAILRGTLSSRRRFRSRSPHRAAEEEANKQQRR